MFSIKSKKRQEEKQQPVQQQPVQQMPEVQQPIEMDEGTQNVDPSDSLQLLEVLENLRQIHGGACMVTILVLDNRVQITASQQVAIKEQQ